jgi:hypothetical protein
MTDDPRKASTLSHPLRWLPEFLEFGKRRFRTQGRVLGAAILVGIVAGLGGVLVRRSDVAQAYLRQLHGRPESLPVV